MSLLKTKKFEEQFLNFVSGEKKHIDFHLKNYFTKLIKNEPEFLMKEFYSKLRDFIMPVGSDAGPAKRTRPMCLIHTFFGIANDEKVEINLEAIRKISISIELLHNASIIHDDVVEQNSIRRGLPTFQNVFSTIFNNRNQNLYGNAELFGYGMSINGGDICAFLGSSLITDSNFQTEIKSKALEEYHKGYNSVVKGKIIEAFLSLKSFSNCTIEDYMIMTEAKAAQFDTAVTIGAILADTRLSQINPLRKAIKHLGVAYQIKKNIKALESTIKEKRRNIILIIAYRNGSQKDKKNIDAFYNSKSENPQNGFQNIHEIIKKSGALDFLKVYSKNSLSQAEHELDEIYPGLRSESLEFFEKLFNFVLVE